MIALRGVLGLLRMLFIITVPNSLASTPCLALSAKSPPLSFWRIQLSKSLKFLILSDIENTSSIPWANSSVSASLMNCIIKRTPSTDSSCNKAVRASNAAVACFPLSALKSGDTKNLALLTLVNPNTSFSAIRFMTLSVPNMSVTL